MKYTAFEEYKENKRNQQNPYQPAFDNLRTRKIFPTYRRNTMLNM